MRRNFDNVLSTRTKLWLLVVAICMVGVYYATGYQFPGFRESNLRGQEENDDAWPSSRPKSCPTCSGA